MIFIWRENVWRDHKEANLADDGGAKHDKEEKEGYNKFGDDKDGLPELDTRATNVVFRSGRKSVPRLGGLVTAEINNAYCGFIKICGHLILWFEYKWLFHCYLILNLFIK